jgi:hypothetical protein
MITKTLTIKITKQSQHEAELYEEDIENIITNLSYLLQSNKSL